MKRTWKQIGSMLLAVCMVFTLLPTMAFAETGDVDSGVPLGASGEITAFAALDAKTVEPGTPEDELKLPDTLDATLTEGDDTATGSDATKETETTVAVSGWTSDPAYDGDDEGDYIFTPTLALPDGLTLAEGVSAPTITVTVEAKPAELPQARGAATPFGAGASSVNNATGLKTALESPTADTITVTESFTLTDAVEVKADHTLIIESGVILTLGDLSPGSATLTVPIDETLTVNGAGTLEVSNTTTSFGVVVMGSMIVSGGNLTVKNSGEYTTGIYANGPLSIENNSVLSVANAGRNTGIQGNVTITNSTATISNTNSNMTECKGISASPLTIDNSTVTMSNSINSAGIHSSGANITLKNNAQVIAAGQGNGIYFGVNSGSLTVDGSTLELQSGYGLNLSSPDDVSFTGLNSGTVKLAQGVVVGSANGKMKDQGIVLTKKNVTVGAAEAESSATGLTAGDYVWDGEYFAKSGGTFFDTATATFNLANLPTEDASGNSDETAWTWSNTNKLLKLTGTGTYTLTGTANGMGVEVTADGATVILDGVTLTGADVSDYGLENKLNKGACPLFSRSSAVPLSLVVKNGTTNVITAISISALYAAGNLTLTGTGSLTVTGGDGYSGGSGIDIEGNSCIVNGPAVTAVGGNERLPMSTEGGTLAIQSGSLTLKNIWNNYDEALEGNGETLSVTVASGASFTTVKGEGNGHGYLAGTDVKTTITNNGGTVFIDGSVLGKAVNNDGSFTVTGVVAVSEGTITKPSLPDVTVNLASTSASTEDYEVVTSGTSFADLQNKYGTFTTFLVAKKAADFTLTGSGVNICWVDTNATSTYIFSSMTIGSYAINSVSVTVTGNNASGGTLYAGNQSGTTYTGTGTLAITKPSGDMIGVGLSLNNGDNLILDGPTLTVSSYETAINKLHIKSGSFTADGVADYFEISGGTAIFNDTGSATLKSWNVKHTGGQLKIITYGTLEAGSSYTDSTSSAVFNENGGSLVADTYLWGDDSYTVTKPADPTKSGFVFGGWYTDAALENEAVFGSIATNTVYYAKWIAGGTFFDTATTTFNLANLPTGDVNGGSGDTAWVWSSTDKLLKLTGTGPYTLTGTASGKMSIMATSSNTNLTLSGASFAGTEPNTPALYFSQHGTLKVAADSEITGYVSATSLDIILDNADLKISGPSTTPPALWTSGTEGLSLSGNGTVTVLSSEGTAVSCEYGDLTVESGCTLSASGKSGIQFYGAISGARTISGGGTIKANGSFAGITIIQNGTEKALAFDFSGDLEMSGEVGVLMLVSDSADPATVAFIREPASLNIRGNSGIIEGILQSTGAPVTVTLENTANIPGLTEAFNAGEKVFSTGGSIPTESSISGTIKGNDTNSGIGGATVRLKDTSGAVLATTTTDASGQYSFDKLEVGTYRIEASATGYRSDTLSNIVLGSSDISGKDITLIKTSGGSGDDSGGGGSSSGSTTTPATTTPGKTPNQPVTAAAPVTATAGQNGAANASIPEKSVTDAIAKAQADAKAQGKIANGTTVALNVTMPKGATSLTANLTRNSLNSLVSAGVTSLELNGSPVTVSFDTKALAEIQKQSSGNISITIVPNAKLSASAKAMIGTRPVYDLTVSYTKDGKNATVSSFNGGTATVSVPYTPAKGESIGGLYAVYVDAKGNATRIAGSAYDANSGCVMFTTTHFSLYGIGYTAPSAKFADMKTHWAKESIDYVVGRGLLSGTTETTFAPDTAMTRGMLVTALGRLAGVDVKTYTTSSFTDVTLGSAFQPYIEWAYKKGVVQGTGNGKFEPNRAITREEIAVIFSNYAKATGYTLPVTRTATTYADASSIGSAYQTEVTAMQQAGIMMGGTSNKFNPKSSATRAEVSSMLHRYIKLTIDPATAQGWAKNDAGQYLYYKDGKALTGTQTIDGVKYFFNADGTLKTGWVKDDAGNWRFYSGNTMLVGFWDLGANGNNKTYYFTKDGIMVAGKWLEIDGKWYYFNADGSLAKSTKVDGYEVDENGVRKMK